MTARQLRCHVCGEEARLRVLDHVPSDGDALTRYECLKCGVIMEHWTAPMSTDVLARFGYRSS